MKVKAPSLLKKIIEALSSKTNELRIRMMIFFLLHKNLDKSSLTNSLHALVSHHHHHHHKKKNDDVLEQHPEEEDEDEESKGHSLLMNYNKATSMHAMVNNTYHDNMNDVVEENMSRKHQVYNGDDHDDDDDGDDDDGHDDDDGDGDDGEKHPRVEMEMEDREDIDQAADLFIQRFKKQMLLQKQRSLERQQWLLLSNA